MVGKARGGYIHGCRRWLGYGLYYGLAARVPSRLRSFRRIRVATLRLAGVDVAWSANINAHARISSSCRIRAHAGVGQGCGIGPGVTLEEHVTMGPGCLLLTGDHPVPSDGGSFRSMESEYSPIVIGEDAFLGARVIVLPGVTVGPGAALGAGAVISKDVPAGATMIGNPARMVKRREV